MRGHRGAPAVTIENARVKPLRRLDRLKNPRKPEIAGQRVRRYAATTGNYAGLAQWQSHPFVRLRRGFDSCARLQFESPPWRFGVALEPGRIDHRDQGNGPDHGNRASLHARMAIQPSHRRAKTNRG